jgi:hypothetical protein
VDLLAAAGLPPVLALEARGNPRLVAPAHRAGHVVEGVVPQ